MSYTCVPEWMKPAAQDPFDYKLRSKEEVVEEFKYFNVPFPLQATYIKYAAGDTRMEDNLDNRDRVAKIWVHLNTINLAPLQRERFIYLLGNRWTGSDKVKIVCRQYNTFHENFVRAHEIMREIYWEAKRAPDTNTIALRNPYRREFFKKKYLGRTREERVAKLAELEVAEAAHKIEIDKQLLGLDAESKAKDESQRKKRRELAAKRSALGFNDKGKEEVSDAVIDDLEYKTSQYEQQIEEKKERKPVKMVTDVKGISKEEIQQLLLRDAEKFKPI